MPSLFIREVLPEDAQTIVSFITALARHEGVEAEINPDVEVLRLHLHPDAKPQRLSGLIAEWDGVPVGVALYHPSYLCGTTEWVLHLQNLFVNDEYRGRGIGHKLIEHVKQVASRDGYAHIRLEVLDTNRTARAFYESLYAVPDLPMQTLYIDC